MPRTRSDDILTVLHELAHLMRIRFDQRARAHDMTRAQWVILFKLEHSPGLTQNQLAALVEVEPITVARLIDRLEAKGMVERRPDPHDRRAWRLYLLPAAEPMLEEIAQVRDEVRELLLGDTVSQQAVEQAEATLRLMKSNLTADGRSCPVAAAEAS